MKSPHLLLLLAILVGLFWPTKSTKEHPDIIAIDGDTFKMRNQRYRLVGVNTPEKGEKGYRQAKEDLQKLLRGEIELKKYGKSFDRVLVLATNKQGCINVAMRQRWRSKKYDNKLTKIQKEDLKKYGWF
jgi:endonuclease YncB( thermonuclease family)